MFIAKKENEKIEMMATVFMISACLILSFIFPKENGFQGLLKGLAFFFLFPILFIKFILRKKARDFGLNIQNKKAGMLWGGLMFLFSSAVFYLFTKSSFFLANYPLTDLMINNFWIFLFTLLVFYNIILFNHEFFFRGFVFFSFLKKYEMGALILQIVLYNAIVIFSAGGINEKLWGFLPFIILSFSSGVVAWKSRSIIFSWFWGLLFLIFANAFSIYLIKN